MNEWWNKTDDNLTYCKYIVGSTEVLVGPRLDSEFRGCSKDFFNSVSAWLSVTESYIVYPIEANVRWFPWKEHVEPLPDHVLYGSMKMLNYWINELKLPRVYVHCDLGTHRAPTILGAFLLGYYSSKAKEIESNREIFNKQKSTIIGSDGKEHGEPNVYINSYLRELPLLNTMIQTIVKYPHLNLEGVNIQSFKDRPLSVYTQEEKDEYEKIENEKDYSNRMKTWLKEKGFVFDEKSPYYSLYDIIDDKGKGSHVVSDIFNMDIFKSLTKYGQVYFTHNRLSVSDPDFVDEDLIEEFIEKKDDLILVKWKKR